MDMLQPSLPSADNHGKMIITTTTMGEEHEVEAGMVRRAYSFLLHPLPLISART